MRQGRWLWAVAALLLVVAAVRGACAMGHRDGHAPSELYRSYENNPHISATFIKDFRVNDSLALDVTVLEARDSVGWNQLRIDFKRPILPPEIEKYINKHNSFAIKQVRRDDPGKGMDKENLANNDFLVIKNLERTFYLFHTDNEYKKVQIMARFTKEIYPKTDQNE